MDGKGVDAIGFAIDCINSDAFECSHGAHISQSILSVAVSTISIALSNFRR
jgi:hypothetical protein